jgi:FlaA1/EpsC-like NDP-sugar epimerase
VFIARFALNIYSLIWRYGGIQSYIKIFISDAVGYACYLSLAFTLPIERISFARVTAICCANLLGALAMRMAYRYAYKCSRTTLLGKTLCRLVFVFTGRRVDNSRIDVEKSKIRIAIVGAGRVGVSLAEELFNNAASAYTPRCFIDVKEEKIGRQIHDIPVLSEEKVTFEALAELEIQEIVFAIPNLKASHKRRLYDHYKQSGLKVKVYDYPVMSSAATGGKRALREFDIEELLFRKSVTLADEETAAYYKDKVILITGGGGSIGSELCRQIATMQPRTLVILDVYENGAYDVQQELRMAYGNKLDLRVEILSVCNRAALERVFAEYRPQIVLNAAAHKHVPLMEHNCCEAVENNVFGTLNTVELSEKYEVERFIMVSTDKAVNPTNVMGATKRMCEMIVQSHAAGGSKTVYSATRFGNVLGSAGSVIPLFKRQIAAGGPVTLTDKRIIRYFMTIPEASQLVLKSGAMAKNGELFVLDMGKPIKILELAENMIRLSGYEPYSDIEIREIGLRPGEKLYEELLIKSELLDKTSHEMIFIEKDQPLTLGELEEKLEHLARAVETGDDATVREALHKVVPTFRTPKEINADAARAEEMKEARETEDAVPV